MLVYYFNYKGQYLINKSKMAVFYILVNSISIRFKDYKTENIIYF